MSGLIEEERMSAGDPTEISVAKKGGRDSGPSLDRPIAAALLAKIESAAVRVGIIGLGYVGLPLARAFSDRGIAVLGFDVDPIKVARLERGESYIGHIPDAVIRQMREQGFEATVDFQRLDEPDVVIICVPTPLTDSRDPDLSYIVNSTRAIAERLRPGQLVVLESTTYPGTTRDVVLPLLAATGAEAGYRLLPGLQPRARRPGQSSVLGPHHPQGRGGPRAGQPGARRRPLRQGRRPGRARLQPGSGRGLQDPRKHVPRHQYRPGQ